MFVIKDFAKLHHASHIIWDIDGTITDENGGPSHEVVAKIICLASKGIFHTFITGRDGDWLIEKIVTPMQKFPMFRDVSNKLTFYGEAGSIVVVGVGSRRTTTKSVHEQVKDHPLATNKRGIRDNLRKLVYDPCKLKPYKGKKVGRREKVIYDANKKGWIVDIDEEEPELHPYIWSTSKEVFATLEKIRDEKGKIKNFNQAPFVQIVREMIKKKGFARLIDVAPAETAIDIVPKAKGLRLAHVRHFVDNF